MDQTSCVLMVRDAWWLARLHWWDYRMVWFVGKKIPGVGDLAAEQLYNQNILYYEPRIRGEDGEMEYLYPSYLLVSLDDSLGAAYLRHQIVRVNRTRGMKRLLPTHLETPLVLPDGYVDKLRTRVEVFMTMDRVEEVNEEYLPNQEVEISCGPWAGRKGIFQRKKKGCLMVLLTLLGTRREVPIPLQNIARPSYRGGMAFSELQ